MPENFENPSIRNAIADPQPEKLEIARLQRQLLQAQKLESVGRLASGIAHDFNNSLAVILGQAELLLLDSQLNPAHLEPLNAILKAGQRAADMTQQLLAFGRRKFTTPQVIDANVTIRRVLELLRQSMGPDITLNWSPGRDLWSIRMDPVELDQLLVSLCINAREAIVGPGQVHLSTENISTKEARELGSRTMPAGDYVNLSIVDNGQGITEEMLQTLMQPNYTIRRDGREPDLGMSTVFTIIAQNHSYIDINSSPEYGTQIHIYFPRVPTAESTVRKVSSPVADPL
jgi:two-component system cell cycle sensor histidine kinase/response regulator CckA